MDVDFDAPAILPALLTPFDERGQVDRAALAAHVEFVIEGGVDGIMPCGTTGPTSSSRSRAPGGTATRRRPSACRSTSPRRSGRSAPGPPLVALKAGVAALMAARGVAYPAALRSPLGT